MYQVRRDPTQSLRSPPLCGYRGIGEFFRGTLKVALKKISAGLRPVRAIQAHAFLEVAVAWPGVRELVGCRLLDPSGIRLDWSRWMRWWRSVSNRAFTADIRYRSKNHIYEPKRTTTIVDFSSCRPRSRETRSWRRVSQGHSHVGGARDRHQTFH
jgi:hypothetical protein